MKPVHELGGGLLIRVVERIYDLLEPGALHVLFEAKREHIYRLLGLPQFAISDAIETSHEKLATQEHIELPKCQFCLEVLVSCREKYFDKVLLQEA